MESKSQAQYLRPLGGAQTVTGDAARVHNAQGKPFGKIQEANQARDAAARGKLPK